jgi:hypothetical protein
MAENTPQKRKTSSRVILAAITLIIFAAAGTYLYAGWVGYREAPKLIELDNSPEPYRGLYELSSDQETNLSLYGQPESFTILFYEEETPDQGIQTVRLETWDYYTLGIGLTFINGELVSEDPIDWGYQDPISPIPYSPEQFSAFMSLDEVLGAAGIDTYIEVPLNIELLDRGNLYYADSLSFGMQDNQLVYLEALALVED